MHIGTANQKTELHWGTTLSLFFQRPVLNPRLLPQCLFVSPNSNREHLLRASLSFLCAEFLRSCMSHEANNTSFFAHELNHLYGMKDALFLTWTTQSGVAADALDMYSEGDRF
jgi:hypothetical protein